MTIAARRWTFAITCLIMFGLPSWARAACSAACGNPTCFVDDATGVDGAGCCTAVTPCKTIQGAVNDVAAGRVISVAAGTYAEPAAGPLTINKTVTLCGAQAGVDARGRVASESIITDSQGTYITANNVIVDGFTIQNSTVAAFTGYGLAMGAGTMGTLVYNNIIQDNIAGIGLANAGASPNQVLICQNQIQNNNQPGGASGSGIYTDQFVSGGNVTNVLVENNNFVGNNNAGIDISNTDSAGGVFLLEVRTNVFNMDGRGVLLFNTHDSTIHNNSITNSTFAGSAAVRLFECNTNLTILFNDIDTGPTYGIRFTDSGTIVPACPSANVVINDNNIVNFPAGGLLVDAASTTGTVNAECNWWGCVTGPNTGGCGTVVGNADFTPWLVAPSPAPVTGPVVCTGGETTTTTTSTSTTVQATTSTTVVATTSTTVQATTSTTVASTTTTIAASTTTTTPVSTTTTTTQCSPTGP